MSEAVPAEQAAAAEKKRPLLRRVPTSLIVTLLGIALTAWVLPAFTRQWDDRQKAHELKAAIADDMARATAHALFGGTTAYSRGTNGALLAAVVPSTGVSAAATTRQWELASFQIEAKLRAYFPESGVPAAWSRYSDGVRAFFVALAQPPQDRPSSLRDAVLRLGLSGEHAAIIELWAKMALDSERLANTQSLGASRLATLGEPVQNLQSPTASATQRSAGNKGHVAASARLRDALERLDVPSASTARRQAETARRAAAAHWQSIFATVEENLLESEDAISREMLRAQPTGYSTTMHDLLRDLIP